MLEPATRRSPARTLFGASPQRTLALLRAAWPRAVGEELARRTEVLAVEGDCLRLRVPDAGWRKSLLQMRREILGRLYAIAGDLTPRRLSFTEGGLPAEEAKAAPATPRTAVPSEALAAGAEAIEDLELRARFLQAAASYLARGRDEA
jgi:hypothetical protein